MPTINDLGQKVKAKYPGVYDDLSDAEVGSKVKAKFPGAYDDFTDAPGSPEPAPSRWSQKLGEGAIPGFNRVSAAVQAAVDPLIPGRKEEWGPDFTTRYGEHLRANQGQSAQTQQEHPYVSAALQTVGSVPTAMVTPSAKVSTLDPRVVERFFSGLKQGAGAGAAYAAGDTRANDVEGVLRDAAGGAAVGGPLGGVTAAALQPVPSLAPSAAAEDTSPVAPSVAEWARGKSGERNIKAAGAIQGDIARARKQIGRDRLTDIGAEFSKMGLTGPISTPEKTFDRAIALQSEAGQEMGGVLKAADAVPEAATNIGSLLSRVKAEILGPLQQNPHTAGAPDTGQHGMGGSAADQMSGLLEKYLAIYGNKPLTPSVLHEIRTNISNDLYGLRGNKDPWASAYKDALHDFRGVVSDEIGQGIDRAGLSTEPWKAANRKYEIAARAEEFADKGMDRAHGNNWVSPTEFLAGLAGAGVGSSHGGPGLTLGGVAAAGATALARRHGSGALGSAFGKLADVAGGPVSELPGIRAAGAAAPAVTGAEAKGAAGALAGALEPGSPLGLHAAAAGDDVSPRPAAPVASPPVQGEQHQGQDETPAHVPDHGPTAPAPQGETPSAPAEDKGTKHVHTTDKLTEVLSRDPSALGPYASPLAMRLRVGGPDAVTRYNFIEQQRNPAYRAHVAKVIGDERLTT